MTTPWSVCPAVWVFSADNMDRGSRSETPATVLTHSDALVSLTNFCAFFFSFSLFSKTPFYFFFYKTHTIRPSISLVKFKTNFKQQFPSLALKFLFQKTSRTPKTGSTIFFFNFYQSVHKYSLQNRTQNENTKSCLNIKISISPLSFCGFLFPWSRSCTATKNTLLSR